MDFVRRTRIFAGDPAKSGGPPQKSRKFLIDTEKEKKPILILHLENPLLRSRFHFGSLRWEPPNRGDNDGFLGKAFPTINAPLANGSR
jgi:hypothetical protein